MNLEIKRFIAVKDQDKATQLVAESFYGLSLPCTSRT